VAVEESIFLFIIIVHCYVPNVENRFSAPKKMGLISGALLISSEYHCPTQ
jgi:hypothetical protein